MANNSNKNSLPNGIFFNGSSVAGREAELFRQRQLLIFFVAVIITNGTRILSNILLLIAMAIYPGDPPVKQQFAHRPLPLIIDLYTAAISSHLSMNIANSAE
ncbi:hypothetical protein BV898_16838 [Hypsibius exemplaris]|uniref:Uncharacterized protein n=1 Tax=Hypsibius exemplaris TaxID=2072580 RepID=A0A9X6RLG5_HYPEX|nr:hypothetical protein BV898_16838 [Hypsibius exemplaris]